MSEKAFQDYYPDKVSHCYGCGRLNEKGLQIKSYWDGDETVCTYTPEEHQKAFEGFVYGGLMASLIDCHSIATAIAATSRSEGSSMEAEPEFGFVTGSLQVDFLMPAATGRPLELRSRVRESTEKKVTVTTTLSVDGTACARGVVKAVRIPYSFISAAT